MNRIRPSMMPIICILILAMSSANIYAETIHVRALKHAPIIDGKYTDWQHIKGTRVSLRKSQPEAKTSVKNILIKGGKHNGYIYFYFEWKDSTRDIVHKTWQWDKAKSKYVMSHEREDRLSIQFAISGDYTTNWLSGNSFVADMWHWKASRSNPLKLAHDKSTHISSTKILRSSKFKTHKGNTIYISRPSDKGDKMYISKRYRKFQKNIMPKYILTPFPQGSVADVEAIGAWKDGVWHVEIRRELDTQHNDDIQFTNNVTTIKGGVAIFDHTENDDHVISKTLTFKF